MLVPGIGVFVWVSPDMVKLLIKGFSVPPPIDAGSIKTRFGVSGELDCTGFFDATYTALKSYAELLAGSYQSNHDRWLVWLAVVNSTPLCGDCTKVAWLL